MLIGEVSKQTNLSIKAIRLYEEKGLIKPPQRRGKYRVFSEQDVDVLKLINQAKSLGVSLAELKDVIHYQGDDIDWQRVALFLRQVKQKLEQELRQTKDRINKVENCLTNIDSCPKRP